MHRRGLAMIAACAALLLAAAPAAADDPLRLSITPWPPYVGPDLPDMGATGRVVGAALESVGAGFVAVYQPALDIESGFDGLNLDGVFPVYATRERAAVCLMSRQIGSSPLGLAERTEAPVQWERLEDLAPYTLGVVRNYANDDAFDRLVARGVLRVVRAEDDSANLRHLLDGVVDLAVIDRNVMEWLLRRDPTLTEGLHAVRFNPRPIAERALHACFRRDERGRRARDLLDQGLARVDGPLLTAQWFQRVVVGPRLD